MYGSQRRRRLNRVWFGRQDKHGIAVGPGLKEFAFRALFPAHKMLLRYYWQISTYHSLAPPWLRNKSYNVCINDITSNIVYIPLVKADFNILRLNDLPEGFRYALSKHIINCHRHYIRIKRYNEIWSAHNPLTVYARELNPANRVVTIHNGVDDRYLALPLNVSRKPKSAVFIGSIEQWIDLELLNKVAILLPDWQFDVIGPLKRSWHRQAGNLQWLPPVSRENIQNILVRYKVGLIPFREVCGRLNYVDRPLKFFEYIGAGLGVVSTDVGALKSCMGDWASYGNTPADFARAIKYEAKRMEKRSTEDCIELIKDYSWSKIITKINGRIENLLNVSKENME